MPLSGSAEPFVFHRLHARDVEEGLLKTAHGSESYGKAGSGNVAALAEKLHGFLHADLPKVLVRRLSGLMTEQDDEP